MYAQLPAALFQLQALPNSPLGKLLVAIVALAVIVLVGRVVLSVAWKLLLIAGVAVAALYAVSLVPF
jgi:low affinity Fe/Cu permease